MPFHIEISSAVDRARVFNVERGELRKEVLEPWVAGLSFEFAERSWQPRDCRLTILEGPRLSSGPTSEDAWDSALRTADDVTRPMLEAAEASLPTQIAVEVDADSVESAVQRLGSGRAPRQICWARALERIGSRDSDLAAVILVVKRRPFELPEL